MGIFFLNLHLEKMEFKPVIYQLFPRLFVNFNEHCVPNGTIKQNGSGKMNDISSKLLDGIKELGVTHVWYTGIIEHAHVTDYSEFGIKSNNPHIVKGNAGSPYAITDYYDIDPDIAENVPQRMKEFEELVTRTHEAGLKVIIDFVPNHVAREYHSDVKPRGIRDFGADDDVNYFFNPNNDFYYITRQLFSPSIDLGEGDDRYVEFPSKASGNDCFTAFPGENDWYETVKLNYGVDYGDGSRHFDPIPPVWFKMLHILRYWAAKGIDGFRCDMVFMVPLEFWEWAIPKVKKSYPDLIFIAEIYDVNLYRDFIFRGGFDYLYDKVNLYDTLRGIECSNFSAAQLTDCWQTVEGIGDKMLNFLENHDEQRFASDFFARDASLVIPSLVVTAMIGRGAVMIYQGQELGERGADAEGFSGQDGRTTIFDYWSMPTVRRWVNNGKCNLEKLTQKEKDLRKKYAKILTLCNSEPAIRNGRFFDLMYVNYQNDTFDPHRQFVFLRGAADNYLVIAVNFSDRPVNLHVNIPAHAFDLLELVQGEVDSTELLLGKKLKRTVGPDTPFVTEVPPHDAAIWKVQKKKKRNKSKSTISDKKD